MNYRHLLLIAMFALAACDGSDSTIPPTVDTGGTFSDLTTAQEQLNKINSELDAKRTDLSTTDAKLNDLIQQYQAKARETADATSRLEASNKKEQLEAELKAVSDKLVVAAGALVKLGKDDEALNALKQAGLIKAASKDGELRQAEALFTAANLTEEAYALYAPDDFRLEDTTVYDGAPEATLETAVDEKPSVMRRKITLNGETVWYTASAGHLTAFAKNPQKEDPQASIFYTAYTRDDLPSESRPVTFFFNGGPGASSIYLHMTSFAPQRAFLNGPEVKPEWADNPPDSFPLIDDAESLIDKSDLVFVDIIPGTGYSQAVAPKVNKDFWGVTVDVELSRQFITRYINFNHRQASPKYLYGESYGGGVRVPKLARALEEAGTSGYEADAAGAKPKVLTGVVFHSSAFDYSTLGDSEGQLPTIAMIADYLKKTTARGAMTLDEYAQVLRDFMTKEYLPALGTNSPVDASKYIGSSSVVTDPVVGLVFNKYDGRMYVPGEWVSHGIFGLWLVKPSYDFSFFEERALNNVITGYLPEYVNYKSSSPYINASWVDWFHPSEVDLAFSSWDGSTELKNGLPDIVATLGFDPSIKLLTVHGYYDTATPFYRSELDLKGVVLDPVKNTTLLDRVPVKNFAGGHMIYYSEEARAPLKKTLAEFYDAPPYGVGPTVAKAQELTVPVLRAPAAATAISMH